VPAFRLKGFGQGKVASQTIAHTFLTDQPRLAGRSHRY
jgi:hypothetical protein